MAKRKRNFRRRISGAVPRWRDRPCTTTRKGSTLNGYPDALLAVPRTALMPRDARCGPYVAETLQILFAGAPPPMRTMPRQ